MDRPTGERRATYCALDERKGAKLRRRRDACDTGPVKAVRLGSRPDGRLDGDVPRPRHVGVIMDGNRRWARAAGLVPRLGHEAGARHLGDLLDWLRARSIEHVSVYVLSADNIRKRDGGEVDFLFHLIETLVPRQLQAASDWQLHVSGDLSLLPARTRDVLRDAVSATEGRRCHLTLAIGYDPRADIATAIRTALRGMDDACDHTQLQQRITAALPGGPVKDIDLVIRTSGERRISGFFPWQVEHAEIYFSQRMWPEFGEADLDDALADYARRTEQPA